MGHVTSGFVVLQCRLAESDRQTIAAATLADTAAAAAVRIKIVLMTSDGDRNVTSISMTSAIWNRQSTLHCSVMNA